MLVESLVCSSMCELELYICIRVLAVPWSLVLQEAVKPAEAGGAAADCATPVPKCEHSAPFPRFFLTHLRFILTGLRPQAHKFISHHASVAFVPVAISHTCLGMS
jgi:hypothetical protein